MGKEKYHFAVLLGSLRKASYNAKLLRHLQSVEPNRFVLEQLLYNELPLYNQDIEQATLDPQLDILIKGIKKADAVLIISPEYNYSVPGGLKNAIDWISRSPEHPFNYKATAIMGVSPGMLGTARMQYHLRQILVSQNAQVLTRPEIIISGAASKFDEAGNLTDDKTKSMILTQMEELAKLSDLLLK